MDTDNAKIGMKREGGSIKPDDQLTAEQSMPLADVYAGASITAKDSKLVFTNNSAGAGRRRSLQRLHPRYGEIRPTAKRPSGSKYVWNRANNRHLILFTERAPRIFEALFFYSDDNPAFPRASRNRPGSVGRFVSSEYSGSPTGALVPISSIKACPGQERTVAPPKKHPIHSATGSRRALR